MCSLHIYSVMDREVFRVSCPVLLYKNQKNHQVRLAVLRVTMDYELALLLYSSQCEQKSHLKLEMQPSSSLWGQFYIAWLTAPGSASITHRLPSGGRHSSRKMCLVITKASSTSIARPRTSHAKWCINTDGSLFKNCPPLVVQ